MAKEAFPAGRCAAGHEYVSIEAPHLAHPLTIAQQASPMQRSRASPSPAHPMSLPTPCRNNRRRPAPPPPLEFPPLERTLFITHLVETPVEDAAHVAASESLALPSTPKVRWVDPKARYLWASRAGLRSCATVSALLVTLAVAIVGLILVIDQGRHSFQAIVPARPKVANLKGLIRFPTGPKDPVRTVVQRDFEASAGQIQGTGQLSVSKGQHVLVESHSAGWALVSTGAEKGWIADWALPPVEPVAGMGAPAAPVAGPSGEPPAQPGLVQKMRKVVDAMLAK